MSFKPAEDEQQPAPRVPNKRSKKKRASKKKRRKKLAKAKAKELVKAKGEFANREFALDSVFLLRFHNSGGAECSPKDKRFLKDFQDEIIHHKRVQGTGGSRSLRDHPNYVN